MTLFDDFGISPGLPFVTTRPPSSPALGQHQSLPATTRMSCSTRVTVFPASTSCDINFSTSAGGNPVVGSSLCLFVAEARTSEKIVVAADGSGDFRTVQQALDHVSGNTISMS